MTEEKKSQIIYYQSNVFGKMKTERNYQGNLRPPQGGSGFVFVGITGPVSDLQRKKRNGNKF